MGFEGKKLVHLTWDESSVFAGLEVTTRRPSMGAALELPDLGKDDGSEAVRQVSDLLLSLLIGWNLENDGEPVPHDLKAFLAQDADVVTAIITAWQENTTGDKVVEPNLDDGSSSGPLSLAASIPMEPLSESQAS